MPAAWVNAQDYVSTAYEDLMALHEQNPHEMYKRNKRKKPIRIAENVGNFLDMAFASEIKTKKTEGLVNFVSMPMYRPPHSIGSVCASRAKEYMQKAFFECSDRNYYFQKSLAKKPNDRTAEAAFANKMIVIDVDAHEYAETAMKAAGRKKNKYLRLEEIQKARRRLKERCEALAKHLCVTAPKKGLYPKPNACVYTGRGIQIYWFIEELRSNQTNNELLLDVIDILINRVESALKTDDVVGLFVDTVVNAAEMFQWFSVDKASSRNLNGLVRLPGTKNKKIGTYSSLTVYHSNRIPASEISPEGFARFEAKKKAGIADYRYNINANSTGFVRVRFLEKLAAGRGGIQKGQRDLFSLIYYCACRMAGLNDEGALKRTLKINKTFPQPENERTIISQLSSAKKKNGGYYFRNSTMFKMLNITSDEVREYKLHAMSESNEAKNICRDSRRAAAKNAKIRTVIRVYKERGNIAEAAREAGVCRNTAKKYIREYYKGDNALAKRVYDVFEETHNLSEVSRTVKVSWNTAHKYLQIARDEVAQREAEQNHPTEAAEEELFSSSKSVKNGRNILSSYKAKRGSQETFNQNPASAKEVEEKEMKKNEKERAVERKVSEGLARESSFETKKETQTPFSAPVLSLVPTPLETGFGSAACIPPDTSDIPLPEHENTLPASPEDLLSSTQDSFSSPSYSFSSPLEYHYQLVWESCLAFFHDMVFAPSQSSLSRKLMEAATASCLAAGGTKEELTRRYSAAYRTEYLYAFALRYYEDLEGMVQGTPEYRAALSDFRTFWAECLRFGCTGEELRRRHAVRKTAFCQSLFRELHRALNDLSYAKLFFPSAISTCQQAVTTAWRQYMQAGGTKAGLILHIINARTKELQGAPVFLHAANSSVQTWKAEAFRNLLCAYFTYVNTQDSNTYAAFTDAMERFFAAGGELTDFYLQNHLLSISC